LNIQITNKHEEYEIHLEPITQLCGVDFDKKQFIIKSLYKHFSNSKYDVYEEFMQDNIRIDNTEIGRKYFSVFRIESRADLINAIKITKSSLMMKYLTGEYSEFECQQIIDAISENLEQLYLILNENIANCMEHIEIGYRINQLMDIIQSSEIMGAGHKSLENLSNLELLMTYLDLLHQIQRKSPNKTMVIFDNMDHFIKYSDYLKFLGKAEGLTHEFDIWFVFLTSTEQYVAIDESNIEGINVINDVIFSFPEIEQMLLFLKRNYPLEIEFSVSEVCEELRCIIQNIGRQNYINSLRSNVFLKLIQNSLCISMTSKNDINSIERTFLRSKNVV
jgi:hypothetical protein